MVLKDLVAACFCTLVLFRNFMFESLRLGNTGMKDFDGGMLGGNC
jgi:hypothetical protein